MDRDWIHQTLKSQQLTVFSARHCELFDRLFTGFVFSNGGQQPSGHLVSYNLNPFNYIEAAPADIIIKRVNECQLAMFLAEKNTEPCLHVAHLSHANLRAGK